jgi:hypothetical protein
MLGWYVSVAINIVVMAPKQPCHVLCSDLKIVLRSFPLVPEVVLFQLVFSLHNARRMMIKITNSKVFGSDRGLLKHTIPLYKVSLKILVRRALIKNEYYVLFHT